MAATATKTRKRKTDAKAGGARRKRKTSEKAATAKATSRPMLDEKELAAAELELRKQYPRIVKGSLRNIGDDPGKDPRWAKKRTVEIRCAHRGCNEVRRIATSDLHQVTMCETHTHEHRLAARRKAREAAKN